MLLLFCHQFLGIKSLNYRRQKWKSQPFDWTQRGRQVWAEVKSTWKPVSTVALGFVLSVCPFGVKRVTETMLRQEEKRREYIKIQQKQKKSSMIRSLIKKITSQWALPYKLVKHFIIEYIFLYQKHKKTFILGTRKIDITGIWFNDSSPFPQVLGAPLPKSAPLAEKADGAEVTAVTPAAAQHDFLTQTETCIPNPKHPLSKYLLQIEVGTEPKTTLNYNVPVSRKINPQIIRIS